MIRIPFIRGGCILLIAVAAFAAAPAMAASYTVNSEADVPEVSAGNGTCDPEFALPGVCTLRAAIQEANAHAGPDTILLTAGQTYALTRVGGDDTASNGDLDITDDLTLIFFASGVRPVVDASAIDNRVFHILSGNVTMFGFDITGGAGEFGGGILVFAPGGTVQLSLMRLYDNHAHFGGGLYNDAGDVTISASEFFDNVFEGNVDETVSGSAIRNRGNLTIEYSSFYRNRGVLLKAMNRGGLATTANTIDSTPDGDGTGEVTITNSTLVGNVGDAIDMKNGGFLSLSGVTVAGNSMRGVRFTGAGGQFNMRDTVVANNAVADCELTATALGINVDRYNLDSDDTCELSAGTSNFPGVEPYLAPLAYHGGPTAVSWPLVHSPLLEHGHPTVISFGCEEDDQHFDARPVDFDGNGSARCDIGAVELTSDVIFFDPMERL